MTYGEGHKSYGYITIPVGTSTQIKKQDITPELPPGAPSPNTILTSNTIHSFDQNDIFKNPSNCTG